MVQKYKEEFRKGSRKDKNQTIDKVVQEWRDRNPPGRFVAKHRDENGECYWLTVGEDLAKKRAAKSLAEWNPTPQQATTFDSNDTTHEAAPRLVIANLTLPKRSYDVEGKTTWRSCESCYTTQSNA